MSRTAAGKTKRPLKDELAPEYLFDYSKAKPNRFAEQAAAEPLVVLLDEDIASVFRTAESVKSVLRALIKTMPESPRHKPARRAAR